MLEYEQIDYLFNRFQNNRFLMTGGAKEGCQHRARLICSLLSLYGIPSRKLWCHTKENGMDDDHNNPYRGYIGIYFNDNAANKFIGYSFHVSPFVTMYDAKEMALDIGLFDKPIPLNEWKDRFEQGSKSFHNPVEFIETGLDHWHPSGLLYKDFRSPNITDLIRHDIQHFGCFIKELMSRTDIDYPKIRV